MSLATNIKEFADVLHNIYAQQLSSIDGTDIVSDGVISLTIPKIVILQQACVYFLKTLSHQIFALLSFQWLRDFSYFPLLSNETGSLNNVMADTFLSSPGSHLFSFSKNGVALTAPSTESFALQAPHVQSQGPSLLFDSFFKSDWLFTGLVNSFFFSFPFSLPHFITLRRMFSQGVAAATASILGTVAAHSLLLFGVIYGIRFLVIPYYSLQPLTFLIGIIVMAIVITEFIKEKRMYLVPLNHYPSLIKIGIINFIVALCESATVFHDLHHLTLNPEVSYLQLYDSSSVLKYFLNHTAYLLTFVIGHTAFSLLFCYTILKSNEKLCSLTGWTLPKTASRINKSLLIAILALTFSTFPYYGLDYLLTKSAGFLPEDPAYSNTIFSPTQVKSRNRHFKSRAPAVKNEKTALELDLNYFDRGMYLNAPKQEKISPQLQNTELANTFNVFNEVTRLSKKENLSDPYESIIKTSSASEPLHGAQTQDLQGQQSEVLPVLNGNASTTYDPALTFEELNYQGESAWLMRHERARRLPEEQDSKKSSIFQKPKSHFKELRANQDIKQAKAALLENRQVGSISEFKEGNRFQETLLDSNRLRNRGSLNTFSKGSDVELQNGPVSEVQSMDCSSANLIEQFAKDKSALQSRAKKEVDQRALVKSLFFDREIAANYEKSFTSPFGEESEGTPPDLLPVENIIKKRYRLNPVYRALLQSDIDFFIARQPNHYKITQNQEASLFKKRQLLEKYYNSIRYYSPIESILYRDENKLSLSNELSDIKGAKKDGISERMQPKLSDVFNGPSNNDTTTKSFVETVYHQQFKGTLNTVKRFFKLTFDEQQNPNKNRILSYDQPLYKNSVRSLTQDKKTYHPSLHEELSLEDISPFVEESNSAPVYAGWDEKARRFVLTNRFNFIE